VSRDWSEIDANDTNTRNIESQFNYGKNGWESKSQAVNGNWNQNAANFGATPE
jgi:hypothetical protein